MQVAIRGLASKRWKRNMVPLVNLETNFNWHHHGAVVEAAARLDIRPHSREHTMKL